MSAQPAQPVGAAQAGLRFALCVALLALSAPAAAQEPASGSDSAIERDGALPAPDADVDLAGAIEDAVTRDGGDEPTHADQRIRWDPRWPRYQFDELVLTLGMGVVIGLAEFLPTRSEANWATASDFDIAVQRGLGLDDAASREAVRTASDVLVGTLVLWPLLVDSLVYTGLGEGAWDVAWQLSLISLEVFAINHALNITVKLLSRRERPLGHYCASRAGYDDPSCANPPPAESFWSGHVSTAFAGAALVCLHHDMLDLFGNEAADFSACGGALAMAATTGVFRIMSDRHWVTDVLTGALLGSAVGILVPWLLHFEGGALPALGQAPLPIAFAPMVDEETLGISAYGLW